MEGKEEKYFFNFIFGISVKENTERVGGVNQYLELTEHILTFSLQNSIRDFEESKLRIHAHILKETSVY